MDFRIRFKELLTAASGFFSSVPLLLLYDSVSSLFELKDSESNFSHEDLCAEQIISYSLPKKPATRQEVKDRSLPDKSTCLLMKHTHIFEQLCVNKLLIRHL